jgi:dihydroorotase-like cyclic amidohydrolase
LRLLALLLLLLLAGMQHLLPATWTAVREAGIDLLTLSHLLSTNPLCPSHLPLLLLAGMQYLLPATWTAVREAGVDLLTLSHLLSTNPAHLTGLAKKGLIAAEMDADLVVSTQR